MQPNRGLSRAIASNFLHEPLSAQESVKVMGRRAGETDAGGAGHTQYHQDRLTPMLHKKDGKNLANRYVH
jgi:hypothetical protein